MVAANLTEGSKSSSSAAAAAAAATLTHVFVFPFASSPSHTVPLLELTHRLLTLSDGRLIATVLLTPSSLPLAQPFLSSHPPQTLQTLILSPPSPPTSRLPAIVLTYRALQDPIVSWFRSHPNPPSAIISDFFLGWTHDLARELNVPRVVFCPSGALGTAVYYSLWLDRPKNPNKDPKHPVQFDRIPGSPVFEWWQLSHVYTESEDQLASVEGDPKSNNPEGDMEFFRESMVANMSGWATVFNSFVDLEPAYLDGFKKELGGSDRVWAVGPLLPEKKEEILLSESSRLSAAIFSWLDEKQPDSSVVYICFGSRAELDAEQVAVLRRAIELSRVAKFLWCGGDDVGSDVDVGLDGNRLMVVRGWVPQVEILRHRAIGGFLTHCGWNSVVEAAAAGVEMVAWPIGADQFSDAKLVVESGVARQVPENQPKPEVLASLLDECVSGEINRRKEKVRWLKEAAEEAVKVGGSSHRDLTDLVKSLEDLN